MEKIIHVTMFVEGIVHKKWTGKRNILKCRIPVTIHSKRKVEITFLSIAHHIYNTCSLLLQDCREGHIATVRQNILQM